LTRVPNTKERCSDQKENERGGDLVSTLHSKRAAPQLCEWICWIHSNFGHSTEKGKNLVSTACRKRIVARGRDE
jgi:hypothetical protein